MEFAGLVVLVLDLGGQVVADVADVTDLVLDHQGNVRGHGQRDGGRQARSLGEQIQVAAGERQAHRFL